LAPGFRKEAKMFTPLLLSLAMMSSGPEPITVVDGRPTIQIMLSNYDLARLDDVKKVKREIRWAAARLCIGGSGLAMYLQSRPCLEDAVADANSQLATALAGRARASLTGAAIVVSASSK
jgi:UrcA family protein